MAIVLSYHRHVEEIVHRTGFLIGGGEGWFCPSMQLAYAVEIFNITCQSQWPDMVPVWHADLSSVHVVTIASYMSRIPNQAVTTKNPTPNLASLAKFMSLKYYHRKQI
ncbi:hypothetical protein SCA6_000484 [Theobroma cacao]